MATKGGGEFFGEVGSFDEGYEFDAVVLDDSILPHPLDLNVRQRIERAFIYLWIYAEELKQNMFAVKKLICGKDAMLDL